MALLDLSLVTKALINLVRTHITASPDWDPNQTLGVSAQPPDKLDGGLGMYLYHLTEDAYLKNSYASGGDVPVRLVPMAVTLYYVVTARGAGEDEQATLFEQRLIGMAAKALHDYPQVDDRTAVPRRGGQPPVEILKSVGLDGAGNKLHIGLQPITAMEAGSYWNAGTQSTRLALYYQVSATLLEPDRPVSVTGRVLRYGVQSFPGSAPRLDGAQNVVHVEVPGLPPQDIVARPAEVPVDGRVTLTGYNLAGDVDSRLVLEHAGWDGPVEVDDTWAVTGTPDQVSATVREAAGAQPVLPGTYTARVRVIRRRPLPDGTVRDFPVLSNGTPFSVSARIDDVTFAGDVGTVTGYAFRTAAAPFVPDAVQVSVGGTVLVETSAADPIDPGCFRIDSASQLTVRLPAAQPAGVPTSLRIVTLGAESPPWWFRP